MTKALKNLRIGILGAGVMGQSIIKGLLAKNAIAPSQLWAAVRSEKSRQKTAMSLDNAIPVLTQFERELSQTDVLILCVKPTGLTSLISTLKKQGLPEKTLIISIVSGHTINAIESGLEQSNPVIRAMPNTPMMVGEAITVVSPGKNASVEHIALAQAIFQHVGEVVELDEQYLDAVTALSGAGPAYVYLMMEALADGGVRVGLPRDIALKLVCQTMKGAAAMVQQLGRHPASLRDDVTTPAGCTIGGLLVMEDGKIRSTLARAVEEATNIASHLGDRS